MKSERQGREAVSGMVAVLVLAGSLLGFTCWVPAAAADAREAEVSVDQEAPDLDAAVSQPKSWWQQRVERRRARTEVYREQLRSRQQDAMKNDELPARVSLPAAVPTDLDVSFKLDRRLTAGLYMGDRWVAPPTYSGIQDGSFIAEARAQGRDARGHPVNINPEWTPADPAMVTVSPRRGTEVTITVHRAGQSSVRVTVPGETEEPAVSTELSIRAAYQGTAIQVEIDTPRKAIARQELGAGNGWKFVDGNEPQSRPTSGKGWKIVDGDMTAGRSQ